MTMRAACPATVRLEVDNGLAEEPDKDLRNQLVDLCGPKWNDGPICCTKEQVGPLVLLLYSSLHQ